MDKKVIGQNIERWDARSKVTGAANYTADLPSKNMLYSKIVRATIAHGKVLEIDTTEALSIKGVVKILTPWTVPNNKFPTAGHPFALDPALRDIADRRILTDEVKIFGDEIAVVIAENELIAEEAAHKVKVTYEEYPFYLTPEESMKSDAKEIHPGSKNMIAASVYAHGDFDEAIKGQDLVVLEKVYKTQTVQHAMMENQVAYAYQDADQRWVCVSSTQIPHICRRVLGQAFDMDMGNFRVIKPLIGGGFGNKQDVTIEPLVVAMSMAVGGRPVMLDLEREETLAQTRVRHAIEYKIKSAVNKDGKIVATKIETISNNGGYASHGHAVNVKGAMIATLLYDVENFVFDAKTVYTNIAAGGAMRGYGVPQVCYAIESHIDDLSRRMKMDPIEFRLLNKSNGEVENPVSHIRPFTYTYGETLELGRKKFNFDERVKNKAKNASRDKVRGVGVGGFAYGSGVYPKGLEMSGCRITLNQDGSLKVLVGATEIGQGSDTVWRQMVAETTGVTPDRIYLDQNTDTDIAPFDTGAYASRQSFVSGMAVKKAATQLKEEIIEAFHKFYDIRRDLVEIVDNNVVYAHNGEVICTLRDLAMKTYYSIEKGEVISVDVSNNCHNNAYPFGCTFTEVEVDTKTGKVEIIDILNVHDSGTIINPLLAEGQVHGGMAMGVAYALSEHLKYNEKTGEPLNNNLLDYKMPTCLDSPDLDLAFLDVEDPIGPYGNKSLGEPPLCSQGQSIRNAIVDAIGVEIDDLPLAPQAIFEALKKAEKEA